MGKIFLKGINRVLGEKAKVETTLSSGFKMGSLTPHPTDFEELELTYKKIPIIYGAINKTVDYTVGPSFIIKERNNIEKVENLIRDLIREMNFDVLLRTITRDILIFGNAFVEHNISKKTGEIIGLNVIDPKTMFVQRTNEGKIEKYVQLVMIKGKPETIDFAPNEISHFKFNVIGSSAYGMGIIQPLLINVAQRIKLEKSLSLLAERKGNPTIVMKVGDDSNRVDEDDINSARTQLEDLKNNQELVISHDASVEILDYGGGGKSAINFGDFLKYLEQQLIYGLEVPAVLLGVANVPEGLAKAQGRAFEKRITSIQTVIEEIIEKEIFKRFLESKGVTGDIEFDWEEPTEEDKREEMRVLMEIINSFMTLPELKLRANERLNELLGFPPLPKKRPDEDLQPVPPIPFGGKGQGPPRPPADQEEHIHESDNDLVEDLNHDYTIKEYIGFDYQKFIDRIEREIDNTDYERIEMPEVVDPITKEVIRESNVIAIKNIDQQALKEVFKEGFREGESIRDMANKIQPYVNDLEIVRTTKVKQDGKFVTKSHKSVLDSKLRSVLITRSEVIRVSNNALVDNYKDAQVEKVQWLTVQDGRQCSECDAMSGMIFEAKNFNNIMPLHLNCRCHPLPVIKE